MVDVDGFDDVKLTTFSAGLWKTMNWPVKVVVVGPNEVSSPGTST
jgi:hypothetical protein